MYRSIESYDVFKAKQKTNCTHWIKTLSACLGHRSVLYCEYLNNCKGHGGQIDYSVYILWQLPEL